MSWAVVRTLSCCCETIAYASLPRTILVQSYFGWNIEPAFFTIYVLVQACCSYVRRKNMRKKRDIFEKGDKNVTCVGEGTSAPPGSIGPSRRALTGT